MSSVEQLAAALRVAMAITVEGRGSIEIAEACEGEATAGFQRVTAGSGDPRPTEAAAQLQRAHEHLVTAVGLLQSTKDAVEYYITAILGADGSSPAGDSSTSPPQTSAADADPLADLPVWGAPRRSGVNDYRTYGRWHGGRGSMQEFVSGTSGRYANLSHRMWTRGIWGGAPPPSDAWTHAEIQFAVFMRASGKRDETISINHPDGPCADCSQLISFYLKEGSTLIVRWSGGEQTFTGRQEHERDNAAFLRELKARKRR